MNPKIVPKWDPFGLKKIPPPKRHKLFLDENIDTKR